MARILVKFSKIKLDKERFTKVIADKTIEAMRISGYRAFEVTFRLVPVWTGESRGGLIGIAFAMEMGGGTGKLSTKLMNSIIPVNDKQRRNQFGEIKSPTSARSVAEGPIRRQGNRVDFAFSNSALGFTYGDKRPLKNSLNAPFGFSKTFLTLWRTYLLQFLSNRPDIGIKSFSAIQRVSN